LKVFNIYYDYDAVIWAD